eukprot:2239273-Rhodomonas_salina.4
MAHTLAQSPATLTQSWNISHNRATVISSALAIALGYNLRGTHTQAMLEWTFDCTTVLRPHQLITRDLLRLSTIALPTMIKLHATLRQPTEGYLLQDFPAWTQELHILPTCQYIVPAWEGIGMTYILTDDICITLIFPFDPTEHLRFAAEPT